MFPRPLRPSMLASTSHSRSHSPRHSYAPLHLATDHDSPLQSTPRPSHPPFPRRPNASFRRRKIHPRENESRQRRAPG